MDTNAIARVTVAVMSAWLVGAPTSATAQDRIAPPVPLATGPGTIVGRVRDTRGLPIDSAEVRIMSPAQRTFSNADGTYRFTDIKPGKYTIVVRKVGHAPDEVKISVSDNGGTLDFVLRTNIFGLPAVVTSAERKGLSGLVADSNRKPIANALVRVMAENREVRTDSAGLFYFDLKPGPHMVSVSHSMFLPEMLGVTLSGDHGKSIEAYLSQSSSKGAHDRAEFATRELRERLMMRSPAWSRILTRDEISKHEKLNTDQLIMGALPAKVESGCKAIIDGGAAPDQRLWTIDPQEIETVEIYIPKPKPGSAPQSATARRQARFDSEDHAQCDAKIYVWLRR